jgi:hypothetical protein
VSGRFALSGEKSIGTTGEDCRARPFNEKDLKTMQWQVQIYVSEVCEWYGWAHTPYDPSSKADADRAANVAKKYGWKVRVIKVR